jgi:Mn2+/Fe2+ NRAMP family transporter
VASDDRVEQPDRPKLVQVMGPGSQVGAQFGYGLVWTLVFSYRLMAAIQEISARIGRVTDVKQTHRSRGPAGHRISQVLRPTRVAP